MSVDVNSMAMHLRALSRAAVVTSALVFAYSAGTCMAATCLAAELVPPRQALIGAWRLVSIDLTTREGRKPDPFFAAGSVGLIVYDPSGWMSVQISGPKRVAWDIPAARAATARKRDLRLKAAAYDSYYAYFGTWDYDEPGGVMTHHVRSSVIPAEAGLDYSQQIRLDGDRMTFIGHVREHGEDITRTKVWERIGAAAGAAGADR